VQRLIQRDQWQKNSLQLHLNQRWGHAYIDDTEIEVQRRHTGYAELGWVHQGWLGRAQTNFTLANRWGVSWFGSQGDAPEREPDGPTFRYSLQTLDATLQRPFSLAGERGFYLRNDIDKPLGEGRQSLYLGLDYGRVAGPSAAGLPVASLAGLALGLRGGAGDLTWDVFASWALHKPDSFPGGPVLDFTLLYQY
jgi:hemolysin activation/secretion protein